MKARDNNKLGEVVQSIGGRKGGAFEKNTSGYK